METQHTFGAKKTAPAQWALYRDGKVFAVLEQRADHYILQSPDAILCALFKATPLDASAPIKLILWAIRAACEHLDALAERARAFVAEGYTATELETLAAIVRRGLPLPDMRPEPIEQAAPPPASDNGPDGGALVPLHPVPPRLPPLDALAIPFDTAPAMGAR